MTDTDRLYQRLRAADPAAYIDRDPDSSAARRMRHRAQRSSLEPSSRRRSSPRRLMLAVALGAMMLTSAVAVASVIFQPEPEDVASILAEAEEAGRYAVHTEGWRPTLRTEEVWCAYEDGTVGSTRSTEFELDEEMIERDLIDACADGPDEARHRHLDTEIDYTLCEGTGDPQDLRQLLADEAFAGPILQGDITQNRPGFPVLLGWDADCAETTIDTTNPPVMLRDLPSLVAANRAREVEIGLTAAALQDCLTLKQAEAMARQADAELQGDWVIMEMPHRQGGGDDGHCRRVWLDPHRGVMTIGPAE